MADSSLFVTPSTLEVDYDRNLTDLYKAITDQQWDRAVFISQKHPVQAATWVVRHYEDDEEDEDDEQQQEVMWRFLPIHSACARQPPAKVVSALIKAYPDGVKCVDDQGMYALHYACGNQANRDVIRQLLVNFPEAAALTDPRGMLPIHYLACWGPSSVSVVDMLLVAYSDVADATDADGNTPLDLALEADYPERDAVVVVLKKWLGTDEEPPAAKPPKPTAPASRQKSVGTVSTKSHSTSTKSRSTPRAARKVVVKRHHEEEKKEGEEEEKEDPRIAKLEDEIRKLKLQAKNKESSLEDEIRSLKLEMRDKESVFKKREADSEAIFTEKLDDLEHKIAKQEEALAMAKTDMENVQKELAKKTDSLHIKEKELNETKKKLKESNDERDGLGLTLRDLMDQHEKFKKRSGKWNDRLGSLSVSLESMMDQQATVAKAVRIRTAEQRKNVQLRKERLKELLDLESTIEEDEKKLETSLKKQSREMEAIAAVIAAARE